MDGQVNKMDNKSFTLTDETFSSMAIFWVLERERKQQDD